jgi:hypothetical protein
MCDNETGRHQQAPGRVVGNPPRCRLPGRPTAPPPAWETVVSKEFESGLLREDFQCQQCHTIYGRPLACGEEKIAAQTQRRRATEVYSRIELFGLLQVIEDEECLRMGPTVVDQSGQVP